MEKKWIGVVGKNGSGKSTVCEHLQQNGFELVSLSNVVRDHATRQGIAHDRDSLTSLANQLKQQHGLDYFARVLVDDIQPKGYDQVVFDSVRHPDEIRYLKSHQVFFIGVDADIEYRYQRICQRGKQTDMVSFEEFKRQDAYEVEGSSFGQQIAHALSLCHVTINNNNDHLCNLLDQVDDIIRNKLVIE